MTVKPNAAYFGAAGKLELGDTLATVDDYTAAVTSCALVPTAPTASVTDIGGGVTQLVGPNVWEMQATWNQDWKTAGALSKQLILWHGLIKYFRYTPDNGGAVVTGTLVIVAGQIGGGAANQLASASAAFKINGQPTIT